MMNFGQPAHAASLTSMSDNMSRLKTSTLSDHTIKFVTPGGVAAGQSFTITFAAGFALGTFNVNNVDVATAATCGGSFTDKTLAASPATTTWGVSQSGQVITVLSGTDTIAATSCISVEIGANATFGASGASIITNPSSGGAAIISISVNAGTDTGSIAVPIVATPFDQVTVTANVDPTISFAITDASIGFGTLTTANVRYATGDTLGATSPTSAHDITVSTNAGSGYTVYVEGATLTSGSNTITAIGSSATASNPNSEQFGIKVTAAGGSGAALAPYNTANYAYGATGTTQDPIASSAGSSATTTFSITYIANIAATTEAGAYSTNLTYTATGSF